MATRRGPSTVKYEGVDRLPSGRYRARYRDAEGRQHSETFDSAVQARDWRAGQVDAVSRGVHVAPNTRTTVSQYARQHVSTLNYRPATKRTAETRLRALEGTPLGAVRLVDVRTSQVRAWASDMERRHAASTAAKHLSWLRSVLAAAVDDRLTGSTPRRPVSRSSGGSVRRSCRSPSIRCSPSPKRSRLTTGPLSCSPPGRACG